MLRDFFSFKKDFNINAVKSGIMIFIQRFIIKFFSFIRTVILARILFPEDFGLFGMATLTLAGVEALTQTGFIQAIVQKKEINKDELSSIWTFQLFWYIFLAFIVYFYVAPYSLYIFNSQQVVLIVKVLSLNLVIRAFDNVGMLLWLKEMRYDKQFWYDILPVIFEIVTSITIALIYKNIWALVLGVIVNRLMVTILSYAFHPFRPKIIFSLKLLKPYFNFGKWVGLAGAVTFFATRFDQFVLSHYLRPEDLGHYVVALSIGILPAVEFTRAFTNVLFPFYSKFLDDKDRILLLFNKISAFVISIAMPASIGLMILASNAVNVVYGQKWMPIVLLVKIFCLFGIIKSFDYLLNPLILGLGRSKISFLNSIIMLLVSVIITIPLINKYGPFGGALALIIGQSIALFVNVLIVSLKIRWSFISIIKPIFIPAIASVLMGTLVYSIKDEFNNNISGLIIKIIFGILSYLLILFFIDKFLNKSRIFSTWTWIKSNIL